ncbi:hypothetical protein LCGC14_0549080 [marine sediment metagenome]|uniref:Uncharacterized protein n=1 Tax=marine sediment metagenome TaxID=412755 RepID=A0A0F9RQH5_9ZZZZ
MRLLESSRRLVRRGDRPMANEKVECPDCGGTGLDWDTNEDKKLDCPTCEGGGEIKVEITEGGVDKASLQLPED